MHHKLNNDCRDGKVEEITNRKILERELQMKVIYDPQTDHLTIILQDVPVKESDEIREGLIVDYGDDGRIVAIETLDASENVSEPSALLYEIKGQAIPIAA